jgi:large subunit ribosomal protein L21
MAGDLNMARTRRVRAIIVFVRAKVAYFACFLYNLATMKKNGKTAQKSSEFAIIETGGKQYMVSVGDVVEVELLGNLKEGDKVEFDKVLMVDNGADTTIGEPYIKGARVTATYQGLKKGTKLTIVRYQQKSNRDRRIGHRQKYAQVKIDALV